MNFLPSSSRSLTRDSLRVVHLRRLLLPGLLLAAALSLAAFAGGLWLGRSLPPRDVAQPAATAGQDAPAEAGFTIDRLGVLVGRLKALEADVLSLRRMVAESRTLSREVSALDPTLLPGLLPEPAGEATGRGGLLLPPRPCLPADAGTVTKPAPLDALRQGEAAAGCLRGQLDRLLEGLARHNAALMAIPARVPTAPQARLGSTYGNRVDPFTRRLAFHSGVDFAVAAGTEVFAAGGGVVSFAGRKGGYGKTLEIDHGNGLLTRYAHLSRLSVAAGAIVTPGQAIGAVGSTGRSTGPHLHFEVLRDGQFVDPQRFLALSHLARDLDGLAGD